jgi:hypothetical protein
VKRSLGRRVFISYAGAQKEFALWLCREIETLDISCWIAPRDIPVGSVYTAVLGDTIPDLAALVVLYSAAYGASPECTKELDLAHTSRVPLFPIRLDDSPLAGTTAYVLSAVQWQSKDEVDVAALADRIRKEGRQPLQSLHLDAGDDPDAMLAAADEAQRSGQLPLARDLNEEIIESAVVSDPLSMGRMQMALTSVLMIEVQGQDATTMRSIINELERCREMSAHLTAAQRAAVAARMRLATRRLAALEA